MATVFFDYDGTLHDTMVIYGPALRGACLWLRSQGWDAPEELAEEQMSCWLGFTIEDMWTSFMPELPEEVWREASQRVGKAMGDLMKQGEARLFEGAIPMLEKLRLEGHQLVFLSNCTRSYWENHSKQFGLDRLFDGHCAAEDYDFIPKWQIYQQVRDQYPGPHVMVGDRASDREVAINGGIPFIGCLYGFGTPGELDGSEMLVDDPAQIPDAVRELLAR